MSSILHIALLLTALFIVYLKPAASPTMNSTSPAQLFDGSKPQTPVFFVSHGGPTFMYPGDGFGDQGAYDAVHKLGKYIKEVIQPKFVIVVSAHWAGTGDGVQIGVPSASTTSIKGHGDELELENELIYDFYGFPKHMYDEKFHTKSSLPLAQDITQSLSKAGIKANITNRGLDHGVWVPLKVAFSTNKRSPDEYWEIDAPLVQVSLFDTDDFATHRELGKVLAKYRELGGVVICSGMSVHNLVDFRAGYMRSGGLPSTALPYVKPFNDLLGSIIANTGDQRFELLESLNTHHAKLLRQAHPTLEHFMPIVVAVGAANEDPAKVLHVSETVSLGWGVYQFGNYNV